MKPHRALTIVGLFILSMCHAASDAAGDYVLSRGRQLLLDHGLQIQSLVHPQGFSDIELWKSANFSTYDFWEWTNLEVLQQLPANQQWARQYEANNPDTKYLSEGELTRKNTLVRYQYGDELTEDDLLSPARLSDMAATYAEWRQLYPNAIVHTNSDTQVPASALATYMQAAQPDMVMFDYYPQFSFPASDRMAWYSAMQTYRLAGLAGNDGTSTAPIPYAQFLNLFRGSYEEPNASESFVGLQQFASWAFGYTLVDGFIYTHIGSPVETLAAVMFDTEDDSSPNEGFDYVQETNRLSHNVGPALVRMISTDIRMIPGRNGSLPNPLPSGLSAWSAGTANTGDYADYITSIQPTVSQGGANDTTYSDVLIGYFDPLLSDNSGATFVDGLHFMIVNGSATGMALQSAQWYHLTFDFADSGFDSLVQLSRDTGQVDLVSLTHLSGSTYYLDLNLPGGMGDLLGFWDSRNPLPTMPDPSTVGGDYNGNGTVDAADYVVWRDTLGASVTAGRGADGNANGMIDADDYDFWRARFGNYVPDPLGSGSSAVVPEPTAINLALLAISLGLIGMRIKVWDNVWRTRCRSRLGLQAVDCT